MRKKQELNLTKVMKKNIKHSIKLLLQSAESKFSHFSVYLLRNKIDSRKEIKTYRIKKKERNLLYKKQASSFKAKRKRLPDKNDSTEIDLLTHRFLFSFFL